MVHSTFFAIVTAFLSLATANCAIIERQGTFTYLTPQPTSSGQSASSSVTSPPSVSGTGTTSISLPVTLSSTYSITATSVNATTSTPILTSTTPTTSVTAVLPSTTITLPFTTIVVPSTTIALPTTTITLASTTIVLPPTGTILPSPSGTANCNGVQQWQSAFAYTAGNRVIYSGQLYTAKQWTYNNAPPAHADQWAAGGVCALPINNQANCNGVSAWQSSAAYTAGNKVTFNGHLWSAVQWVQSNAPGDSSGSWQDQGACA